VVPFAVLLALHAWHYLPFLSDDALISLRYADRLLEGDGLTWNDGERVEGYSNLLWILFVAVLGLAGIDLIDATRVLGFACSILMMLSLACTYSQGKGTARFLAPALALGFVALAAPMAVWAIGGLEQPLYAALLAIAIASLFRTFDSSVSDRRPALALSLALGLLCLTRPDGPIFTVAVAAALVSASLVSRTRVFTRALALVLAVPTAFYLAHLTFRLWYYGELLPNTALVKLSPTGARWRDGWTYFAGGLEMLLPFSVVGLAAIVASTLVSAARARAIALLLLGSAWSGYVMYIGGDIFPAYRHLVPLVVVLAFALAEGALLATRTLSERPAGLVGVAFIALLLFIPFGRSQFGDKQSQRAIRERWEWECRDLALTLKQAFWRQQPLVAVTAAGCLPYWSGLPSLDMLGLNDYYLPRHPPSDVGTGFIGHELGDGKYVFERRPDLIVFNVGSGPHYRSGEELDRMPEFHSEYVPMTLSVPGLEFAPTVYVLKSSPKVGVGITRTGSSLSVPGFLLAGTTTALNGSNELIAWLSPGASASVTIPDVDPSGWTANVRATNADVLSVDVERVDAAVSVVVRSKGAEPVGIHEVVLRRN
jgi:hypothetical protein